MVKSMGRRLPRAVPALLLLALVVLAAAPAALAAGPGGWVTQDLPQGLAEDCSGLAAVCGSSDSEVLVAASCGALLQCDGQAWVLRDRGPLAAAGLEDTPSRICAIWGASAADLLLAGTGYSDQDGPHAAVYRLGESGWTAYPVLYGDTACVNGLWGASASDNIYAVGGDEDGGCISRWNGAEWARSLSYEDSDTLGEVQLNGVWGSSASDVYAVGGGMLDEGYAVVLHFDGAQWSAAETGPSNRLNAVWGSSASDVFAVGAGGTILHYDGAAWTSPESGTAADLTAVWGSSASNVFAAGHDAEAGTAAILYYDGLTWSRVYDVATESPLRGLWGHPASEVLAVGDGATILRYAVPASTGPVPAPAPPPAPPAATATATPAAAGPPLVAAVQAHRGRPGDDLTVTITGANLGSATAVDFGSGITVNEVSVISETEIAASIAIDSGAAAGQRTVTVTTARGAAIQPEGFVVREAASTERVWVYPVAAVAGALAALATLALLCLGLRRRPAQ